MTLSETTQQCQNHFRNDLTFTSSPIHQQRLNNGQTALNSTPSMRSKRRNSDSSYNNKKIKEITCYNNELPKDQLTLENINLEEYPKFHHPEGGIIQFTPIGNIRTFMSDNNVIQRVIEKNSKFDLHAVDRGIDGYKIFLGNDCSSGGCGHLNCSPSNEIEGYMRTGYSGGSYYNNPAGCFGGDYDCDSDFDDDDYDMN